MPNEKVILFFLPDPQFIDSDISTQLSVFIATKVGVLRSYCWIVIEGVQSVRLPTAIDELSVVQISIEGCSYVMPFVV